jgi:Icc-related predicted phosphoesterase
VAIIADQHGNLPPIPPCDLLIVSGDITGSNPHGPRDRSDDYWRMWFNVEWMGWRSGVPTIAVAGNHDTCFEHCNPPNIDNFYYLCDSGCEFHGLKFWGAPWVRKWDSLAFNITDEEMTAKFGMVPLGTDVVVCHMPPLGAGDLTRGLTAYQVGSPAIADMVRRVKPRILTCGHIHEGRGVYDLDGTTVVNAAGGFVEIEL